MRILSCRKKRIVFFRPWHHTLLTPKKNCGFRFVTAPASRPKFHVVNPINPAKKTCFNFSFFAAPHFWRRFFSSFSSSKRRRPHKPRSCRKKTILFFRQRETRNNATGTQIRHSRFLRRRAGF
jgi:hypothetical protein